MSIDELVRELSRNNDELHASEKTLRAELAAANERIARLEKALNKIASWDEGAEVTSQFDEPYAARVARDALANDK